MRTTRRLLAATAAAALALTACGDDDTTAEEPEAIDAPAEDDEPEAEPDDAEPEGETITVTAVDYGYQDLPGEMQAGTTVVMQNASEAEVHEILAFRVKDGEERSVAELIQAGEAEFGAAVEMRGVALAPPGASSAAAPIPPLVLEQPGTYAFVCFLPTDGPPDEIMAAVAAFVEAGAPEDGAPDYPETGPPHAANGMFAEVVVTA